ncbi:MAG: hypothetical protein DRN90_01545 [Thermoproteota archaeon]|nr:MAG: hypothetical protein DRN92_02020 [Candidatus Korarchaeota archaeon]RLG49511.1 MAG: hypothetical protein DRN90_01545 [Candidatus Korarchaeota archaeon]
MQKKRVLVKDIMSKPGVAISKDEIVEVALELMDKKDVTHLLVLNKERGLVGILTAREIMDGLGSYRFQKIQARRIYVSALMTEPPITIEQDEDASKAADIMISQGVEIIPVIKDSEVVGVVTETDLIKLLEGENETTANKLMNPKYPRINPGQRIVHARTVMLETRSRLLPVCSGERLLGLVTEMALAKTFYQVRENFPSRIMDSVVRRIIVEDIMLENPPTVKASENLDKIIQTVVEVRLPAIPVVGHRTHLLGVLERRSLLKKLLSKYH